MNPINIKNIRPTHIEKTSQLWMLKGLSALKGFAPKLSTYGAEGVAAFEQGGRSAMLAHMEQYAAPTIKNLGNNTYSASHIQQPGWLKGGLGDMAKSVRQVTENVGAGKSVGANAWQVTKNLGTTIKTQLQDSRFKIVQPGSKNIFGMKSEIVKGPNGEAILKGKGLFRGSGDRKAIGEITGADGKTSYLFKKRKLMQPLSMAMTPVGFGATAAAFEPGGAGKKTQAGVTDTVMWTAARPIAEVKLGVDMIKPFFKKTEEIGG